MNNGTVIIVDDDVEDQEFLKEAWIELGFDNPLIFFSRAQDVLDYLRKEETTPFLILCDVNMPKMNGFELKDKIAEDKMMNYKSIPFVFWSSTVSEKQVQKAYDIGVNGFFIKDSNLKDLKQSLNEIVKYWAKSKTPEQP